jgi:hypothetical protein
MKSLAAWIMNRIADDGSSEWLLAMRREFDELQSGHLGWAMGCWQVKLRQNFSQDLMLVGALLAVHILGPIVAMLFNAMLVGIGITSLTYALAFCYAAPWAILLGRYRPNSVMLISLIGGAVFPSIIGFSSSVFVISISNVHDSAVLAGLNGKGLLSSLVLWLACASIGQWIAHNQRHMRTT